MFETKGRAWKQPLGFPQRKQGKWSQRALVHTFQLRRVTALEGAFAAKGGAFKAGERRGVDVMLVWDAAVHWLASHLLVPLALATGHRDTGPHLEGRGGENKQTERQMWGTPLPLPRDNSESYPGPRRSVLNCNWLLMN